MFKSQGDPLASDQVAQLKEGLTIYSDIFEGTNKKLLKFLNVLSVLKRVVKSLELVLSDINKFTASPC